MKTDAQRARDARKRAKLRAHKAQKNANSPNAVDWPYVDVPKDMHLYEFIVFGTKTRVPDELAYDVSDTDGISYEIHNYFRQSYLSAKQKGLYWFLLLPKDQEPMSDTKLKKLVKDELEECMGLNHNDLIVFIVGRP